MSDRDDDRMGWPYAATWIAFFALVAFGFKCCTDMRMTESSAKVAK